jgi:hypothetical protein
MYRVASKNTAKFFGSVFMCFTHRNHYLGVCYADDGS